MGRGWAEKFFIPKLPACSLCFQITILDDTILSVKGGSPRKEDKQGGAGGVIQIIGSCGEIQRPGVMIGNGGSTCFFQDYPENGILVIIGISQVNYTPAIADQLKHCLEVARLPAKPNPQGLDKGRLNGGADGVFSRTCPHSLLQWQSKCGAYIVLLSSVSIRDRVLGQKNNHRTTIRAYKHTVAWYRS